MGDIEGRITKDECRAMRILYNDGWSIGVLKMTFHLSDTGGVAYHLNEECKHEYE